MNAIMLLEPLPIWVRLVVDAEAWIIHERHYAA